MIGPAARTYLPQPRSTNAGPLHLRQPRTSFKAHSEVSGTAAAGLDQERLILEESGSRMENYRIDNGSAG